MLIQVVLIAAAALASAAFVVSLWDGIELEEQA